MFSKFCFCMGRNGYNIYIYIYMFAHPGEPTAYNYDGVHIQSTVSRIVGKPHLQKHMFFNIAFTKQQPNIQRVNIDLAKIVIIRKSTLKYISFKSRPSKTDVTPKSTTLHQQISFECCLTSGNILESSCCKFWDHWSCLMPLTCNDSACIQGSCTRHLAHTEIATIWHGDRGIIWTSYGFDRF